MNTTVTAKRHSKLAKTTKPPEYNRPSVHVHVLYMVLLKSMFIFFKGYRKKNIYIYVVISKNTKDNIFLWEPEKVNCKFHWNCENKGKISCIRFNFGLLFVKFNIYFLGLQ